MTTFLCNITIRHLLALRQGIVLAFCINIYFIRLRTCCHGLLHTVVPSLLLYIHVTDDTYSYSYQTYGHARSATNISFFSCCFDGSLAGVWYRHIHGGYTQHRVTVDFGSGSLENAENAHMNSQVLQYRSVLRISLFIALYRHLTSVSVRLHSIKKIPLPRGMLLTHKPQPLQPRLDDTRSCRRRPIHP